MASTTLVWVVTGCSTGFGRELAELVLARGWKAVVTARDEEFDAWCERGAATDYDASGTALARAA